MENHSPEEKLLKLIRNPKKPAAVNKHEAVSKGENKTVVSRPSRNFIGKPLYGLVQVYFIPQRLFKLLFLILIISMVSLGWCFLYPLVAFKQIKLPVIPTEENKQPALTTKEDVVKPYEFYANEIRKREVFVKTAAQPAKISAVSGEAQSIKDISLLGIISMPNPQAIVEDKKTQKTYYLTKGQFIGEFEVEDIQEGKLILNSKGKRYELNI